MTENRRLEWDGCNNVRDLGGLTTLDGRLTRWGAVVRSDDPAKLAASGWEALYGHGIRTIISLQTEGIDENDLAAVPHPSDLTLVPVAIEDFSDPEFVQQWVNTNLWCTPLYYHDALRRWPERHVRVLDTIAQARPGGVLFHCSRGNDRTGIITILLLSLAGVAPQDILKDYEMSPDPHREELLTSRQTSTREVILDTIAKLDVRAYLLEGGLSRSNLEVLRERLLEPLEAHRQT
jgi:protein-tyrosine phosphatase